jgi:hypothetical protein
MKVTEFNEIMKSDLDKFVKNMNELNQPDKTFLEHFKHFQRWMEIETYMEHEYYPDGNPICY